MTATGVTGASETFFSTEKFVGAWCRSFRTGLRPLAIAVRGSGPPRTMHAVAAPVPWGLRSVALGPMGLYASPGWGGGAPGRSILLRIVRRLKRLDIVSGVWNVRFDHGELAGCLASLNLPFERTSTHALHVEKDYDRVFARYNATTRNQVRKTRRLAVQVRDARGPDEVAAYYEVHRLHALQHGGFGQLYPLELFVELTALTGAVRLLVAEWEGRIIAGGLFFVDGCSVLYWHAASDRAYSHCFPAFAVLDHAIQWACERGAAFVNFGGSGGIDSLERFKEAWGASRELNWCFEWHNPFWRSLGRLKRCLSNATPSLRQGAREEG